MAAKKNKSKKVKQAPLPKTEQTVAAEVAAEKEKQADCENAAHVELRQPMEKKDKIMVVLYGLLMFVAMTVQTARMSLVLTALAVVLAIGKKPLANLRAKLSLPVLGMIAFALMNGFASLHSRFDGAGAAELNKFMAAFSLIVVLLTRFEKKHVRGLLWAFATICAVIALVCVDMGSWGKLFAVFNKYVNIMGGDFSSTLENSLGGRVNGIYNDANLTGSLLGLAILISSYLTHTAENVRERFCGMMVLGVSAVSFMVAMSRGAILMFGISVLVYLALEGGTTRTKLFFLLLTGGAVGAGCGAVALMTLGEGEILPVLLALLAGPVAFAVDFMLTAPLAKKLEGRGKLVAAISGGVVVAIACFAVVAFQVTEPLEVESGDMILRGMKLEPGEYTISGDWEVYDEQAPIRVRVYQQTREQRLMNKSDVLYNGAIDGACFVVAEDADWIRFAFLGGVGVFREVTLSDGTEVPLNYTFIPEAIVGRLQDGMLKGHSFQQRLQYLRDGMTIFKQSPLIGHGFGASEYLLVTVQPYFYESLFIHNHIIQIMDEMGLMGLAAFLLLMLGTLFVLIRRRMKADDSLAAVLIGCWLMMNLHGLMEISFSVRMFQCAAYFVVMIAALAYAEPKTQSWSKIGSTVLLGVVCLHLAVFGSLLYSHRAVQKEAGQFSASDVSTFMAGVQNFVKREAFDKTSHQLNYVANALMLDDPAYNEVMYGYVEDLHETNTYQSNMGLARYYYIPQQDWDQVFACARSATSQLPSNVEAWNMQVKFYRDEVLPAMKASDMGEFVEGIDYMEAYLERYNEGRMEEIVLSEESQAFVDAVNELSASGASDGEVYQSLLELSAK